MAHFPTNLFHKITAITESLNKNAHDKMNRLYLTFENVHLPASRFSKKIIRSGFDNGQSKIGVDKLVLSTLNLHKTVKMFLYT